MRAVALAVEPVAVIKVVRATFVWSAVNPNLAIELYEASILPFASSKDWPEFLTATSRLDCACAPSRAIFTDSPATPTKAARPAPVAAAPSPEIMPRNPWPFFSASPNLLPTSVSTLPNGVPMDSACWPRRVNRPPIRLVDLSKLDSMSFDTRLETSPVSSMASTAERFSPTRCRRTMRSFNAIRDLQGLRWHHCGRR